MTRLNIYLFFQVLWLFSHSQTESIKLVNNWQKGEVKKYEIKSYFKLDAENQTKVNSKESKYVTIEVLEVESKEIKIKWSSQKSKLKDSTANTSFANIDKNLDSVMAMINQDNPFSDFVKNMDSALTIYYTVHKNKSKIKVSNIDEIVNNITQKGNVFLKGFIEKNNIDKNKTDMLFFQFSMMFLRKESIEMMILEDIKKFHQIYNNEFSTNETTTIPDDIFAANENDKLSNSLDLKLTSIDKANNTFQIVGKLRCTEGNERLRNFLQNMRDINYTYIFKSPQNWPIKFKTEQKSNDSYTKFVSITEMNLIE